MQLISFAILPMMNSYRYRHDINCIERYHLANSQLEVWEGTVHRLRNIVLSKTFKKFLALS